MKIKCPKGWRNCACMMIGQGQEHEGVRVRVCVCNVNYRRG